MIEFRDAQAREKGFELLVHVNEQGVRDGIGPFTHGSNVHTHIMKTVGLRQALDKYRFDAAFGGARRDEEKSRAKERIFSFRNAQHGWDPKNQRPEMWKIYNTRVSKGESIRVFPSPTGPNSISGNISCRKTSRSCRFILPRAARWWSAMAC